MKRPIALFLSLLVTISSNSITSAYILPTDIDDKCTNVYKLKSDDLIHLPTNTSKTVCGCKTCTVDALTYEKLEDYLNELTNLSHLQNSNKKIIIDTQKRIDNNAAAYTAGNVALIGSAAATTFGKLYPNLLALAQNGAVSTASLVGLTACGIVVVGGVVVGLYYANQANKQATIVLISRTKINNIKQVLKSLSKQIERKGFKNNNFLFVTTNYDPVDASTYVNFKNKTDITYDDKEYNENFFNNLNKNIIKPALKDFDNVFTYEDESNYDYSKLENAKDLFKISLPINVVLHVFSALEAGNPQLAEKILLKIKGMDKAIVGALIAEFFRDAKKSNYNILAMAKKAGQTFCDIYLSKQSIESGKNIKSITTEL